MDECSERWPLITSRIIVESLQCCLCCAHYTQLATIVPESLRVRTCLQKPASNSRRIGLPKAPPNDPQRQGNIWHRYEQLESSTKQLTAVNQQLSDERDQYKKVQLVRRQAGCEFGHRQAICCLAVVLSLMQNKLCVPLSKGCVCAHLCAYYNCC